MVLLSRPLHFLLFGASLVGLFAGAFHVTRDVLNSDPVMEQMERIILPPEPLPPIPPEEPKTFPDLVISNLATRECLTTDPMNQRGGTLTVTVKNQGEAATGGFRIYVELQVENTQSGVSFFISQNYWEENLTVGDERTYALSYAFPIRQVDPVGPITVNEPVPGSYRLHVTVDKPRALEFLGSEFVLEESDETNNAADTQTGGTASGLC